MQPMRFKATLTPEKLAQEHMEWYVKSSDLRFGQFICNYYLNDDVSFPNLYYERVNTVAYEIALQELLCG